MAGRSFAVALGLLVSVPGMAHAAHGGAGVVTPSSVGSLRMGVATEADVIFFAGAPDASFEDPDQGVNPTVHRVLGYTCGRGVGGPRCRTYYGIDASGSRLVNFSTSSKQFATKRGTRVGHSRRSAQRRERRRPEGPGCFSFEIRLGGPRRILAIGLGGGTKPGNRVKYLTIRGPGGGKFFGC